METSMLVLAVLLAAVQQQPTSQAPVAADVVVIASRRRAALDRCLERKCPPEEEVDAAMDAGAEAFAAGQYDDAKSILRRAVSRNAKYARVMPGKISDLYATYADVAEHEGDETAFINATRNSVTILRRALGEGHPTSIRVSARLGDMWAKLAQPERADGAYRDEAERAARLGRRDLAGMLTFRRAWLALAARDKPQARKILVQLERDYGSEPVFAQALAILRARLALGDGKDDGTEAFIAALRSAGTAEPVLMSEPRTPRLVVEEVHFSSNREILWADIGFWIQPDGRIADLQILRPIKNSDWAKPILQEIATRRYSPVDSNAGDIGVYRVLRYTLRSKYSTKLGSRIRLRAGDVSLHLIDITKMTADRQADMGL